MAEHEPTVIYYRAGTIDERVRYSCSCGARGKNTYWGYRSSLMWSAFDRHVKTATKRESN